jgi:hypothetical protein
MTSIPYAKDTQFLGRNGTFRATGLEIYSSASVVLRPITSKGKTGRCGIEIPANPETLRQIAAELTRIANIYEEWYITDNRALVEPYNGGAHVQQR